MGSYRTSQRGSGSNLATDGLRNESDRMLKLIASLRARSSELRLDAVVDESGLKFSHAARLLTRLRREKLIHSLPSHAIFLTTRGQERARALA